VKIFVYDIFGRVVKVLVDRPQPAGRFSITWDGRNERGEAVASGVYFYEVAIGEFRQAKKLVVLK
jgi:flagellar hook assembly protein FlgD